MLKKIHPHLNEKVWCQLSKKVQILNIGAELSRAKNWLGEKEKKELFDCLDRAFELIDLSLTDKKWSRGRWELCRLREVLAGFYLKKNKNVGELIKMFRVLLNFDKNTSMVKI